MTSDWSSRESLTTGHNTYMRRPISYKTAGVNIDEANKFVEGISRLTKPTLDSGVVVRKGSFGALYAVPEGYKNPVMVSSTDGVGTKLLIANLAGKHDTVGIDLVAMNVNDILCTGAKPLFFLDYLACGRLDRKVLTEVMKGIAEGCRQAGCSLIGGETAEMPGMYKREDYDLAGFTVGVVERDKIIDGSAIREGDAVIGLASSGIHSNGYSLVRKVLSRAEQKKYAKELLAPTKIYVKPVLKAIEQFSIKGIAHITGGAFYEKLTKVLPEGLCFEIDRTSWEVPKIFQMVQKKGKIGNPEMFRTFNMGIGMAVVVDPGEADTVRKFFAGENVRVYKIGQVVRDKNRKLILN